MKTIVMTPMKVNIGTAPATFAGSELSTLAQDRMTLQELQMELGRLRGAVRNLRAHPVSTVIVRETRRTRGVDPGRGLAHAIARTGQAVSALLNTSHKMAVQAEVGFRSGRVMKEEVREFHRRTAHWYGEVRKISRSVATWERVIQRAMKGVW